MCKALKLCQKGSGQDCEECFSYGSKVFSPEDSFSGFSGKLCDCILKCEGFYLLVEIKDGKLNMHEVKDAIEQLKNCEKQLKKLCGDASSCYKVLLFSVYDVPPSKNELAKKKLNAEGVHIKSLKTVREQLCEYFRM